MKNKKSNSNIAKNLLSTLIVIVLIAATVAIGFFSSGFRNWTKEDWQNVWDETFEDPTPEQDDGSVTDENGNELDQTAVNPMPSSMAFSLPMAAEGETLSVTISATVKPETAINKNVDWEIFWVNPESEWASGKTVTDYVTVAATSDGSTTATVTCLQPFGEQISIKVTSRANTDVYAVCAVDYIRKIQSVLISASDGDYSISKNSGLTLAALESEVPKNPNATIPTVTPTYIYNTSISTKPDPEIINTTYYIKASDEFLERYSSAAKDFIQLDSLNQVELLEKACNSKLYVYHAKTDPVTGSGGIVIPGKPAGYTLQTSTWNAIISTLSVLNDNNSVAFELKIVTETSQGTIESIAHLKAPKYNELTVVEEISVDSNIEF